MPRQGKLYGQEVVGLANSGEQKFITVVMVGIPTASIMAVFNDGGWELYVQPISCNYYRDTLAFYVTFRSTIPNPRMPN